MKAQEKGANWGPKGTPKDDDEIEGVGEADEQGMGEGGELRDGKLDRELFGNFRK